MPDAALTLLSWSFALLAFSGSQLIESKAAPSTNDAPAAKPALPIEISVVAERSPSAIGEEFEVKAVAVLTEPYPAVVISFQSAHGPIVIVEGEDTRHTYPAVKHRLEARATVKTTAAGKAELRAVASVQDDLGRAIYAPAASLYIVAATNRVVTGSKGYLELELGLLKQQLDAGEISKTQYDEAVGKAMRGGATTSRTQVDEPRE